MPAARADLALKDGHGAPALVPCLGPSEQAYYPFACGANRCR